VRRAYNGKEKNIITLALAKKKRYSMNNISFDLHNHRFYNEGNLEILNHQDPQNTGYPEADTVFGSYDDFLNDEKSFSNLSLPFPHDDSLHFPKTFLGDPDERSDDEYLDNSSPSFHGDNDFLYDPAFTQGPFCQFYLPLILAPAPKKKVSDAVVVKNRKRRTTQDRPQTEKALKALRENPEKYLRMKQTKAAKAIGVSSNTLKKAFKKLKEEEPELNLPDQWPKYRRCGSQMEKTIKALRENPEKYLKMNKKEAAEKIGVGFSTLKRAFNKLKKEPELNLPDRWPKYT